MAGKSSQPVSDDSIIQAIREGNERMLVLLYERNYQTLKQHIVKNSIDSDKAQDIIQEAIIITWQNVMKPDFTLTAKLDTFIFSVARNLWLKELRKNKRTTQKEDFADYEFLGISADNQEVNEDVKVIIQKALVQTGDVCRKLLLYFYFDGLDMEQIGKLLGFNNSDTVKAKKYQCKKKLEEIIKSQYNIDDFLN